MKPNTQRRRRMILPALLVVALLGSPIAPTSQAARMTPVAAASMAGGTVVGWGDDNSGQVTIPAEAQSGVTAIAAGSDFGLALKNLSLPQQVTQLITQVQNLVIGGSLSASQGAGLITKLNGVTAKHNGGQTGAACNQLGALINQVNGLSGEGALSPAQGQALITAANNIKANLGC